MMMTTIRAFTRCFTSNSPFRFPRHGNNINTTCSCCIITLFHLHSVSHLSTYPNPNYKPKHHPKLQELLLEKSKVGFDKSDDAIALFDRILLMKPLPNVIDFTQLLFALVKTKDYSVALCLFRRMRVLSIPVDVLTFNTVINCCCLLNQVEYGFALLAAIFKLGFVPDVVTYTTLVRGLISRDKFLEAEFLVKKLIKYKETEPSVVLFSTIIDGMCKTGNTSQAIMLLRYMEKKGCMPTVVTYGTIIDGYPLITFNTLIRGCFAEEVHAI